MSKLIKKPDLSPCCQISDWSTARMVFLKGVKRPGPILSQYKLLEETIEVHRTKRDYSKATPILRIENVTRTRPKYKRRLFPLLKRSKHLLKIHSDFLLCIPYLKCYPSIFSRRLIGSYYSKLSAFTKASEFFKLLPSISKLYLDLSNRSYVTDHCLKTLSDSLRFLPTLIDLRLN